ncbi:hypothetical protein Goshw_022118 [Gossypium schwendimanii]|uniref:RNase H type-1 domain-containing protein n=1 Tax=Gossypium schwendimanii TaxID=34291 RepID=A0A7J9KZE7_GOSSC|nr:hypothetical protein [Gossypium schwendimanii]
MDCPLSDMVIDDGSWNLELFCLWVFKEVINRIVGVLPPHTSSGPENIICNVLQLVPFLKSAYEQLHMNAKRVRRGVSNGSACGLREHDFEEILLQLIIRMDDGKSSRQLVSQFGWGRLAMSIWNHLLAHLEKSQHVYVSSSPQLSSNWVRLNTDGLVRIEEGFATVEGLARDHNGSWIIAFGRYLGNNRVREPELWGILDGLKLIIDQSFERVLIQIDCLKVVNTI